MAISLLPESELQNFRSALAWIRNCDHGIGLVKSNQFPLLYTFVPGNDPLGHITAILLRRKSVDLPVPYVTFVLTYGNEVFQTVLPSPERDSALSGQKVRLPYFPTPYELDRDFVLAAPIKRELIDLTSRSLVKGETIQTVMRYIEHVSRLAPHGSRLCE
jgi:hypothetical protein